MRWWLSRTYVSATDKLAEAGCSEHEIIAQLGHVTPQMAALYTKAARRKSLSASNQALYLTIS
ncbi:hypothetical protein [Hyphomicrobium sp.]|jgi:hypothetical protein|uniref:hypothetical protein n=1 Tax=Hyphomicrobium sp. TaxID=82 RepID=UPI0035694E08